jgi:hypothetical protein
MAGIEQLFIDTTVPLHKVKLIADIFPRFLPFQVLLFLQMGAHDIVEITIGLGSTGHGGRRRAIDSLGGFFNGVDNAFYALDVSLALLQ